MTVILVAITTWLLTRVSQFTVFLSQEYTQLLCDIEYFFPLSAHRGQRRRRAEERQQEQVQVILLIGSDLIIRTF